MWYLVPVPKPCLVQGFPTEGEESDGKVICLDIAAPAHPCSRRLSCRKEAFSGQGGGYLDHTPPGLDNAIETRE
jgi:hypothetical protein